MNKQRSFLVFGLTLLLMGGLLAPWAFIVYGQPPPLPLEPAQAPTPSAANIEWERIHSGTLDGALYNDLYWGGISNSSPTLVDIDDDGDLDLFVFGGSRLSGDSHELHFFRNDGTATGPAWTHVAERYFAEYNRHAQFADLDGDGDYDCVLAGWPWEPEGFIYYENTGSAAAPAWTLRTTDMLGNGRTGDGQNFALVDMDNDGDLDLSFLTTWEEDGDYFTSIAFYENTGSPSAPAWTFVTNTYDDIIAQGETWQSFNSIAFVDIDNDDDLDLFLGQTNQITHYRNDGTPNTPIWTFVTDTYGGIELPYGWAVMHFGLTFGDLDGNGTLDLVVGQTLGWLTSFKNTGTPTNASWSLWVDGMLPMDFGSPANPALADIDADGDLDLFLAVGSGLNSASFIFLRNDGNPAAPLWTYVTGNYAGISLEGIGHPTFVDSDGDGDLDLFIGSGPFFGWQDGRLYYYENTGIAQNATFTLITDTYLDIVAPSSQVASAFADIDGDGDEDLFVAISNGDNPSQIHFYRNDGNATTPLWTHVSDNYEGISASYLAFSDVDGDGDLDLFTNDAFYGNDGDASNPVWAQATTPEGLTWSSGPPTLGDLLGDDGRPDLVPGGNGGVYLYRNLGDLPPRVASVAPGDGGSSLRTAVAVATFNSDMDAATLIPANVQVQGSASGVGSGTLHYEADLRQLYFITDAPFVEGETMAVTLRAAISDVDGLGLDGNGNGIPEGSPIDDYVWSFAIHERDNITVLLPEEPWSLYWYTVHNYDWAILDAIYDGAIESKSFGYQPIILERLPSVDNGDATITPVTVQIGDTVVNTYDEVVMLTVGEWVRPAGCRSDDCAVEFDGAPVQMDQLAVDFYLLPNLHWSDGAPLTTHDSVYSYQLASTFSDGDLHTLERTASYVALDLHTTRWTALPGHLTSEYQTRFWQPLPQHAWGHLSPEELVSNPISAHTPLGWGPYAIQSWQPGVAITLTANPYYHRAAEGLPVVDTLIFRFQGDPALALAQVTAGEADAAIGAVYELASIIAASVDLEGLGILNAHLRAGASWEHVNFGITPADDYAPTRPDFFADVEMRRAIAYCLDRQTMADAVSYGYGMLSHTYILPEHPLSPGDENLALYPHNVISGTALLESMGWSDTDADGIRECRGCTTANAQEGDLLTFKWQTSDAAHRLIYLPMAQADLSACGIDLTIQNLSFNELGDVAFSRQFDLVSFAWLSGVEPPCSLYLSSEIPSDENGWAGNNLTGYSNPTYDTTCRNAMTALPGSAEYATNHQEAMRILSEDLPAAPLFARLKTAVAHPRLINFRLDPTHSSSLYNVEVWDLLADGQPPEGTIQAGDGSQTHETPALTLHLDATDQGGGAVAQMFLRERVWDGSDWAIVAESGWISYAATYPWMLEAMAGAHYLSAYWMDDSGNVSTLPAGTLVNFTPPSSDIAGEEIVIYRVRIEAGQAFTATLTTHSGDADLYVWAPGNEGPPDWYSDLDGTALDQVVVTDTVVGDYHLEVRGYAVASTYQLTLDAPEVSLTNHALATGPATATNSKPVPEAPLSAVVPDNTPAQAPGGLPAMIALSAPRLTISPNGETVQLTAQVWDQQGADVADGTPVAFVTTLGSFADSGSATVTVHTGDGLARVTLVSGATTGIAQVTAVSGSAQAGLIIYMNNAPAFTSTPVVTVMEDELYTYAVTVEDINGDALTITAPTLPDWLALTDHGDGGLRIATLSGTPAYADTGEHLVVLRAVDSAGSSVQQVFTITVVDRLRIYLPVVLRQGP